MSFWKIYLCDLISLTKIFQYFLFFKMGLDERNVVLYNSKADILSWQDSHAGVAQLVEQLIRNQQVSGSSPLTSSIKNRTGKPFLNGSPCGFFMLFWF